MDRAERDKLPVPPPLYPCSFDGCRRLDHVWPPSELTWSDHSRGWCCPLCVGKVAEGPNLADVLAERFGNVDPAHPCGARSRHRWVADGSEPLQCNRPADHVDEEDSAHAHYDHQSGLPISGWTR